MMEYYFLVNGLVSLITLALVRFYPASVNYRYYLVCFTLFIWLVPWHLLGAWLPASYASQINWIIPNLNTTTEALNSVSQPSWSLSSFFEFVLYVLFITGLIILSRQIISHSRWQSMLESNYDCIELKGENHYQKLYINDAISSAVIVGFISPRIWISPKLIDSPHLETIVAHENQHIVKKDNIKLLVIMIIESLFWWNPLVKELTKEFRFLIEASCDEALCKQLGEETYLTTLSTLMLFQQSPTSSIASAAISSSNNNLKRVKQLKEKPIMNVYKKMSYVLTLILSLSAISAFAFSGQNKSVEINSDKETMDFMDNAISLNFQEIPLHALIKIISDFANLEGFEVSENIMNKQVTIDAYRIPLTQLFDLMSSNYNLKIKIEDKKLLISENSGGLNDIAFLKFRGNQSELGALINFSVEINKPVGSEGTNTQKSEFTVWTEFRKQSFIRLNNQLQMSIEVFDKGDVASVEMKFMELNDSPTLEVIAEPAIATQYDKEATIEIGDDSGERLYIKINPSKTKKPS